MRLPVVAPLLVTVALTISCSEASDGKGALSPRSETALVTAEELNTVEGMIGALFRTGMEEAAAQRWAATLDALERGNTKVARQHMMQLAGFALTKESQEQLDDPDGDGEMTVNDGVLRLISLMFGAVLPGETPPPTELGGDFVVAVVDGSHQTVVTPAEFAGVEFPAGAAPEPFVLVVKQSAFTSFEPCQGPLRTRLCQYPRFYEFHPFPYTALSRPAKFGVCHVTEGSLAPSKAVDARLRLAHDAPPGAPRPGYQTVDGAEILPLAQINFLECHPHVDVIDRIAAVAADLFLPRKAYAIDLGGGGSSDEFSNFNVVDPGSPSETPPDIIVADPRPPKIHPIPPRDR
jgi:hypothetical protein